MISVIIPVYNAEKYLSQCLDSVIGQTYRDIEIVCVDDGSTDSSPAILEKYRQLDDRIVIYKQSNQGLSGARNSGMTIAHGEWCMFVDSDDWLEQDCCQSVIDKSKDHDLVIFSYIRQFANKSLPKTVFGDEDILFEGKDVDSLFQRLISPTGKELGTPEKIDSLSTAWGKLYRTDIINRQHITFVDTKEIGTEDLLFNVYYFTYVKSAYYLSRCLYDYRKVENSSLSSANKPRLVEQWETLFKRIEEWIKPMDNQALMQALDTRKALCIIGVGLNILFAHESHRTQYLRIKAFMKKGWYRDAVDNLPLRYFPVHWKLFFGCAKRNLPLCVYALLYVMYKMIYK